MLVARIHSGISSATAAVQNQALEFPTPQVNQLASIAETSREERSRLAQLVMLRYQQLQTLSQDADATRVAHDAERRSEKTMGEDDAGAEAIRERRWADLSEDK